MSDSPLDNPARRAAVKIVKRLRDAGHVAYLAGGCVRDELLGLVPKDYDVATDADPDRVRSLFRHSRFVGEAFGVVLVRKRTDDRNDIDPQTGKPVIHQIEVATFRNEWGYEDGRRPSEVEFTDAEHDAQRRDFTINGLFEDPFAQDDSSRIIDFVGGVADLKAGILRAIGNADERFGEDYLRMLRAVRFAARFGFELESKTTDAIRQHAPKLAQISCERIGGEVLATLDGPHPEKGLQLIESLSLDGAVLDEPVHPCGLSTVNALAEVPASLRFDAVSPPVSPTVSPTVWLGAWFLDRHVFAANHEADQTLEVDALANRIELMVPSRGGKVLSRWRNALCLANDLRDRLRNVLASLITALRWESLNVAQRKRLLARTSWPDTRVLLHALTWLPACEAHAATVAADVAPLIEQGIAPPRLLTGDDLIAMGIPAGKQLGVLLEAVYDEQLELRVTTREDAVVWIQTNASQLNRSNDCD